MFSEKTLNRHYSRRRLSATVSRRKNFEASNTCIKTEYTSQNSILGSSTFYKSSALTRGGGEGGAGERENDSILARLICLGHISLAFKTAKLLRVVIGET